MKKKLLVTSVVAGVCAVSIACIALSGALNATADERSDSPGNVVLIGDPKPLSEFTELPGEEGFVSLERMRAQITELENEDPMLGFSSNPYDYIRDGKNPYYNEIVKLGQDAVPDLKRELAESPNNGLEEYLFGVAIEDIMNADTRHIVDQGSLPSSGKEFLDVWTDIEGCADERIKEIVTSDELSLEEKAEALSAYGALAVPELNKLMDDDSIDSELKEFMQDYVDNVYLSTEVDETLDQ